MEAIESILRGVTGARCARAAETLQRLWSGYGSIVRYTLEGAAMDSVIVKHIAPPHAAQHPRGWNTDRSHQRKLRSYAVETHWYQRYAAACGPGCRVPKCLAVERSGQQVTLVLEDLDAAGYPRRADEVTDIELEACLQWLATFRALPRATAYTCGKPVRIGIWIRGRRN